ncbi:MAG: carbamoyltransferase C-terminal domain-containing protein [Rhodospirillaceae bacterium]
MTVILGLNAYHADSAACLVVDGILVAAVEEERFRRVKHWAGFPAQSIEFCLKQAGMQPDRVDHIAINRNTLAAFWRKIAYVLRHRPPLTAIRRRLDHAGAVGSDNLGEQWRKAFPGHTLRARLHAVEHHQAHLASSFLVSPFEQAALVSIDGFGDFASVMWGYGQNSRIDILDRVAFPHSLGLFYLAITQYLGFASYGDEYKVMGLASYGRPQFKDAINSMLRLHEHGRFALDLAYFTHHSEGIAERWPDGRPNFGRVYSPKLITLLGPKRQPEAPVEEFHADMAASLQAVYEDAFFHVLREASRRTGATQLCLAGGCAMNSVANGKIKERSDFTELFVQPAAGDAGGAIGAALHVWSGVLGHPRGKAMTCAALGPSFTQSEIIRLLDENAAELAGHKIEHCPDETELCERVAATIAEGKVVGWFYGRMEWGPRALGNRSILGDPRRPEMKDILNHKIKRRESFRPFAPSVLRAAVSEWFETTGDVPFMLQVFRIRPDKRPFIPAVTHIDGTGRLQTVTEADNGRYWRLISAFARQTGVPMVLNTSFNENEPLVCQPVEALSCFLRTSMDMLVIEDSVITRLSPHAISHLAI